MGKQKPDDNQEAQNFGIQPTYSHQKHPKTNQNAPSSPSYSAHQNLEQVLVKQRAPLILIAEDVT